MKLARRLFLSLEYDRFYGTYSVMNDNNFVARFVADSDEESIEKFMTTDWGC